MEEGHHLKSEVMTTALGAMALVYGVMLIAMIVSFWKIFVKAGKPGWASIVPVYSAIVLLEIVGKPVWWIFLFLLFPINIIFIIIVMHRLSLAFHKDITMTLLLIFLPFVGLPILAFGDATYAGAPAK